MSLARFSDVLWIGHTSQWQSDVRKLPIRTDRMLLGRLRVWQMCVRTRPFLWEGVARRNQRIGAILLLAGVNQLWSRNRKRLWKVDQSKLRLLRVRGYTRSAPVLFFSNEDIHRLAARSALTGNFTADVCRKLWCIAIARLSCPSCCFSSLLYLWAVIRLAVLNVTKRQFLVLAPT